MRRLARRLFALCSAVSLLLCAAVCVLWLRSHWYQDALELVQKTGETGDVQRVWSLWTGRGIIGLVDGHFTDKPVPHRPWEFVWSRSPVEGWARPSGTLMRSIGFGRQAVDNPSQGYREVFVPLWLPAALLAISPGAWLVRSLRLHKRLAAGHCVRCGYDLRASPERCPECGAVAAGR